jgi:hypothetical protein
LFAFNLFKSRDRRKRLARPIAIIVFSIFFIFLPFFNYIATSFFYDIPLNEFNDILGEYDLVGLILLFLPFLVGIGLLSVSTWGWYFFLGYAGSIVIYNIIKLIMIHNVFSLIILGQTIFGLAAIAYFIRKDISAPYMMIQKRGWRLQKRKPIKMPVSVNGEVFSTLDASPGGLYLEWKNCSYIPGDEVDVFFERNNERFSLKGGITRIDQNGCGLAFRYVNKRNKKILKSMLK